MADTESLCTYGCETELHFCTEFNQRNDMFRSCTHKSDQEAKRTYHSWMKNGNNLRSWFGIEIPFKNLSNCESKMWKMLACTIHLKPCLPIHHTTQICR